MNDPIIRCCNLTKSFGKTDALSNLNLSVGRGKIVGLLGPNGSGKTTLIKLANGLISPSGGEIFINGQSPGSETKKIVSYLPDKNCLNLKMTPTELVSMFRDFYDNFDSEKALSMIESLNISPKEKLKNLSKGNREKISLILAMSRKAELYLLDEPIGGVDPAARDYILDSILKNYSENSTILISTHLIFDVEKILDEVIFIKNGNVLFQEDAELLREREGKSIDEIFREVFKCYEN